MTIDTNNIDYFNKQLSQMDEERSSHISHYKDLQEFVSPRRGRFFEQDRNKGDKRHQSIINSVATQSLRIGVAGMLNGTMSPARPFFSLETFDPDLMEDADVRDWLYKTEIIIRMILNESNFYNMAPVFLKELLLFGTSLMTHVDDFENVARFYTHTAGSYYLSQNENLEIDRIARKFEWPVIQIVGKFGKENCSKAVQTAYDRGNYQSWFPVVHFIEPNINSDGKSNLAKKKPFISVYYEPGNNGPDKIKFLSKSGFNEFPGYAVRWDVTEGDIYGVDCPGMTALGDVKHLQIEEKRKAQAIDKMVNPPLHGPPAVRNIPVSGLAGGLTVYEGDSQKQKLEPIYTVDPRLQELRLDMDAVERRIKSAFFVDLFLAITDMEGIQPRNQLDLSQRNEERLIQLGPVLERLHSEFLSKMIDRVFTQALKANILPAPPTALEGHSLKIRFISTLAMAQRAVITSDIERLSLFTGTLAGYGFDVSKFNADQAIDEYSKAIGVPPKVINSDKDVAKQREMKQQQIAAQQTLASGEVASNIAKNVAQSPTNEDNLLGKMMQNG